MAITDLRDQYADASADSAGWVDDGAGTTPTTYTLSAPPGVTTVISDKVSNTRDGIHFEDASPTGGAFADGDTIYIWWNTIFGAVNTLANGGVRMTFSDGIIGGSLVNFFEVNIGGSDTGKTGWQLTAVNIGKARRNPDATGGTPPAAASVITVGIRWDITANVSGNNDNVAIGNIYRQTDAERTLRVDGTTETWATIATDSVTNGIGIVVAEDNGTFTINGSIAFGPTTNVNFTFSDTTGRVIGFTDYPFIESFFYQLQMDLPGGYSSTANLVAGTKTGSGASATGANGWSITTGGALWRILMDDADQTNVQFYGCTFAGAGDFELDDPAVEVISTVLVNCGTIEVTGNATAASMPRWLNNTFANCPGPRAQVVWQNAVSPSIDGFNGNQFTGMNWFGLELGSAMTGNFTFEARDNAFNNNGTNRDILASNDVGILTFNTNQSPAPTGTNGTTVVITMVGSIDRFAFTVVTYQDVSDSDGTDVTANNAPLVTQSTASLTVDEDTFAVAAAVSPATTPFGTLTYTGASDQYTDDKLFTDLFDRLAARIGLDEVTPGAATRTGFPVHSEVEDEAVQAIIHVNEFVAATLVTKIDPEFRPWQSVVDASTITFAYGAALAASHSNTKMFVIVIALDDATAANTAVSTLVIDTGASTQALTSRQVVQDDNIAGPGNSLELSVFDLHEAVDTTEQGGALTIVANPVTTLIHVDDDQGVDLQNARVLAEAADGTGIYPFLETVTIVSTGTTATATHTSHGMATNDTVVIRGADQEEYNGPFVITVTDANTYTYTMDSDPTDDTATGTITGTGAFLQGLTDSGGDISFVRVVSTDTPIRGFVSKSSASPRFKRFNLTGNTVDNVNGLTVNVRMILDE